jgi:predicted TIM-barrel fold metal-dependent hydrolase
MTSTGLRLYSCDDHLDISAAPPSLWTDRLPSRYREIGPRVIEMGGTSVWMVGDIPFGVSGNGGGYPTALSRVEGLEADGLRPSDPARRLEDMDRDGVHASIVYGPAALFRFPIADPEHMVAALGAWNDWAAEEFNRHAPDRLIALPFLPSHSPEAAAAELERCATLGHRGAILDPFESAIEDPAWDRLWSTAAETGLPLSFHVGGGTRIKPERDSWKIASFASIVPMQLAEPLAIMMYSGALERTPGLKLVLAESGVGWLPYFLARLDATFEKHSEPYPAYSIRTRPSELFERQVWATFEEEPLGPTLLPLLPPRNFMWASDYPHPDSTWPRSHEAIAHTMGDLPPETVHLVTSENCRSLYDLP